MDVELTTARRVAQNQSTFRGVNEEIEGSAREIGADLPRIPFVCECSDVHCTEIMRLSFGEYEAVRADATQFAVAPGHERCVVDGVEVARIRDRLDCHTVMEKIGAAGEEARRLDGRGGP